MLSKQLAWFTAGLLTLPLAATSALAEVGVIQDGNTTSQMGQGMMSGGGYFGGFGMVLAPIFMILVLVAVIVAVVYIVRRISSGTAAGDD